MAFVTVLACARTRARCHAAQLRCYTDTFLGDLKKWFFYGISYRKCIVVTLRPNAGPRFFPILHAMANAILRTNFPRWANRSILRKLSFCHSKEFLLIVRKRVLFAWRLKRSITCSWSRQTYCHSLCGSSEIWGTLLLHCSIESVELYCFRKWHKLRQLNGLQLNWMLYRHFFWGFEKVVFLWNFISKVNRSNTEAECWAALFPDPPRNGQRYSRTNFPRWANRSILRKLSLCHSKEFLLIVRKRVLLLGGQAQYNLQLEQTNLLSQFVL